MSLRRAVKLAPAGGENASRTLRLHVLCLRKGKLGLADLPVRPSHVTLISPSWMGEATSNKDPEFMHTSLALMRRGDVCLSGRSALLPLTCSLSQKGTKK